MGNIKKIILHKASVDEELLRLASKFENKLSGIIYKFFQQIKKDLDIKLVEKRLAQLGVVAVQELISDFEDKLSDTLQSELTDAINQSGRISVGMIPNSLAIKPFRFNILDPTTVEEINSYIGTLVVDITKNTILGIQQAVQRSTIAGAHPRTIARDFRDSIGLTRKQEAAVYNYKHELENLLPNALKRGLRDKRFDRTIVTAITQKRQLPSEKIDAMVTRYRERYIKYRSQVIARTEALRTISTAEYEMFRQQIDQGRLNGDRVKRFWSTAKDERIRANHRAIPGMNEKGVGPKEMFQTPLGPLRYPRDPLGTAANVIQCRCSVRYEYIFSD